MWRSREEREGGCEGEGKKEQRSKRSASVR